MGRDRFTVRDNVLGHSQQGGTPSPDGTVHAETPNSAVVLGLRQATYTWEAVSELAKETDFSKRIPKENGWWMKLRKINDVLAKHASIYEEDAVDPTQVQQLTTAKSKF